MYSERNYGCRVAGARLEKHESICLILTFTEYSGSRDSDYSGQHTAVRSASILIVGID